MADGDAAGRAAEFEASLRRAGLNVSVAQRERLLPGYVELREVMETLRGRAHTAEPSNIFALKPHGDAT